MTKLHNISITADTRKFEEDMRRALALAMELRQEVDGLPYGVPAKLEKGGVYLLTHPHHFSTATRAAVDEHFEKVYEKYGVRFIVVDAGFQLQRQDSPED